MKIVIGGSYHNPNWQEVKRVRKELYHVGHEILMPIFEDPLDINEDFVRFPGDEDELEHIIERNFRDLVCDIADAFVIVNSGGYIGRATLEECLIAVFMNLTLHRRFLIYFTEEPTIFKEIEKGVESPIVFPSGKRMKFVGPDELRERLGLNISQVEYDKLYPLHCKLYEIFNNYPGVCNIGIDELLKSVDVKELPSIPGTGNGRRIF